MRHFILSCSVLCLLVPAVHADIMIDSFGSAQNLSLFGSPTGYKSTFGSISDAAILGQERDVFIERTSSNGGSVGMDVNGSFTGAMAFASSPATTGRARIVYDGLDASDAINYTGLGGVDLTGAGLYRGLSLNTTSDIGAFASITVYTDATHFSTYTMPVLADPSFNFVNYFARWEDFSTAGSSGGADFANVGAITVELDGSANPGTDIGIDYFVATVPEPSGSMLILCAGMVFLTRSRRSRR